MVEFSQKIIVGIILFSFIIIAFASVMANVSDNSDIEFNDSRFDKYDKISDIQANITNPMRDGVFENDTSVEDSSLSSSVVFSKNILSSLKLVKRSPAIVSDVTTDTLNDLGVSNAGLILGVIITILIIALVYSLIKIIF